MRDGEVRQRGRFTQTVTAPADGAARSKVSSGSFEFSRPNRFRFVYQKPFEQTIVADGQTLWLYDADLNQVTVRTLQPGTRRHAGRVAGRRGRWTRSSSCRAQPAADGLDWVLATPQQQGRRLCSRCASAFGARTLAALEILDSFGQRSVLQFSQLCGQRRALNDSSFQFKPPPGADVIQQ